mgnify:CR=1 FL=1
MKREKRAHERQFGAKRRKPPRHILEAIANDKKAPAGARVGACRLLIKMDAISVCTEHSFSGPKNPTRDATDKKPTNDRTLTLLKGGKRDDEN